MEKIFSGLFDSPNTRVINIGDFLICVGCALVIGLILAFCYTYRTKCSKGFIAALALLPAVVCVVIMMVNGNIGAGVAVAGAFGLVRFRSVQGSAKEIGAIFLAMCSGLVLGMGYIAYAFLVAIILGLAGMLFSHLDFIAEKRAKLDKTLRITIPEDLDYSGVFDEILSEYTTKYEVVAVKTVNMGSVFRVTYDISLKKAGTEKEMIDKLRCRNGNLEISISRQENRAGEL